MFLELLEMSKKFFLISFIWFFFLAFLAQPQGVLAAGAQEAGSSAQKYLPEINLETRDDREVRLSVFLSGKDSPLSNYANNFIIMADRFAIDWRLLPAIAGVESSFGKAIPVGSYNAYGWGNGRINFSSWPESIEVVSRALSEKYYQKGLDTPEKIGPVWAPPSPDWADKIRAIMNQIGEIDLAPEPKF